MTEQKIHFIRQQIILLRQKLSALEANRIRKDFDENNIWTDFLKVNEELSQFEQRLLKINQSVEQDIHQCKMGIVKNLDEYNRISQSMREMEKFFLVNYLRPGYTLKQAKRKREYLEKEYARIRNDISNHQYSSIQDVENEIQKVIVHTDNAYPTDQRSYEDEQVKEINLWEVVESLDPQDTVIDYDEDQITNEFKRIVLPATHPDTSDTPREDFLTVMSIYKARDYLLMEAYVAKYQEETSDALEQDILVHNDQLLKLQKNYHQLEGRMARRLKAIKREIDPIEIDQPDKIKENILKLCDELKHAIQLETEKIFDMTNKIQKLTDYYIKVKRTDNGK